MKVLDELEQEITRVAAAARPRRRRRWIVAVGTLIPVSAAVAAGSGMLTGDPVKNPGQYKPDPKAYLGVPEPGQVKILPLRVADPQGGPEWGLQLSTTTRGYRCVQIGRVVDGKLGVLGRDGAFGDDGKFHVLGPEIVTGSFCAQPDARGFGFTAINFRGIPDSGSLGSCAPEARQSAPQVPECPAGSLRVAMFGLLGPQGRAVTYEAADGTVKRAPASGREGAYLVILPAPDPLPRNFGYWSPSSTPGSGLRTVEYRDGSVCHIPSPRRLGGAKRCPAKGYTASLKPKVAAAQVATPVRIEVGRRVTHRLPKRIPGKHRSVTARQLRVVFRARVAADARRFYAATVAPTGKGTCRSVSFGPISRDIHAGQTVRQRYEVPGGCPAVRVTVRYVQPDRPSAMVGDFGPKEGVVVGSATARLP